MAKVGAVKISFIRRIFAENILYFCRMKERRAIYIWQQDNWPAFSWDAKKVEELMLTVQRRQAHLAGMLDVLGFDIQQTTTLESMAQDIVRSSEIEGERLNMDSVRSSIARHLGVEKTASVASDHYTEGVVQVELDAVQNCKKLLTKERLCDWHAALFPTGRSGMYKITVADWRQGEDPMLIVSGAMGKERVHYEAPPSDMVAQEMDVFLKWINEGQPYNDLLKAAVAHLWFVVIHPFDDGNGRITRNITDMLISRFNEARWQFYSVSAEILKNRKTYYQMLQHASCGSMDITEWVVWFLERVRDAIETSELRLDSVLKKAAFWNSHTQTPLNERQRKIINRLFDGFDGPLTSSKWAKICKCSPDTALRDINDLIEKGILTKSASAGRSTHYELG